MLAHKIPQRTAPGLEPLCEEERWTAWVGNNNFEGSDFLLTKPSNAAAMRLPLAPVDGGIHLGRWEVDSPNLNSGCAG